MLIFRGRIRFGELRSRVDDPKFGPFREKVKQEVRFPFRKIFRTHIILFFLLKFGQKLGLLHYSQERDKNTSFAGKMGRNLRKVEPS